MNYYNYKVSAPSKSRTPTDVPTDIPTGPTLTPTDRPTYSPGIYISNQINDYFYYICNFILLYYLYLVALKPASEDKPCMISLFYCYFLLLFLL